MEFAGIDEIYLSEKKINKFESLKKNSSVIKEVEDELKESNSKVKFEDKKENQKEEKKDEEEDMKEVPKKEEKKDEDEDMKEVPKEEEKKKDEKMDLEEKDQEQINKLMNQLSKNPKDDIPAPASDDECASNNSGSCCSIEEKQLNIGFDEEGNDIKMENFENLDQAPVANANYRKEVDLNIMCIKISSLEEKIEEQISEFQTCEKCKGYLNQFCEIKEEFNKKFWKCPFCGNLNELKIPQEKIPLNNTFEYYLEKCKVEEAKKQDNTESSLIFCFDKSGSMSQSYPADSKMQRILKELRKQSNEMMMNNPFMNDAYIGMSGTTYISRLECVKLAIESNLKKIKKDAPKTKVGFVLFGNEVEVKGDCKSNRLVISSNKLGDESKIREMGIDNNNLLRHNIQESYPCLIKELHECEEGGQTALGPAILFSLSMLTGSGNRIFLCTDGCSNLGIGDISSNSNAATEFYSKLGEEAKQKGTIINLITFDDQESEIQVLKELVEKSGGEIIRVNPKDIVEEFDDLLENKFLATEVKVQVNLNRALSFRNEDKDAISANKTIYCQELGNARSDLELYLEFKFKKAKDLALIPGLDLKNLKHIVFQATITYRDLNQNKLVRVITKNLKVTSNKKDMEKKGNYEIVSVNATRKTANLASQGDYKRAMANNLAWKNYLFSQKAVSANAMMNSSNYSYQNSNFQRQMHVQSSLPMQNLRDDFSHAISSNKFTSTRTYERRSKKK